MYLDKNLEEMLNVFAKLEEVEAILIAGSRTNNTVDNNSDYDIYIYINTEIPVAVRQSITSKYCDYMEVNNQFWEAEDDGYLKNNIPVEIIYRDLGWLDSALERTLLKHAADTGYTTCFWSNLLTSYIFYDKNGSAKKLQEKYNVPYPEELRINIINKNYALLKEKMPAYYYQIEKALTRDDMISINHRVAAFFASYFDIIFAVNRIPHPGEKKIIRILTEKASLLPKDMAQNVNNILTYCSHNTDKLLSEIDILLQNLDVLLIEEGIKKRSL